MVRMNEFDQPIGRAVTWSPPEALQHVTATLDTDPAWLAWWRRSGLAVGVLD